MSIENEPLILEPHRVAVEPNGQWIMVTNLEARVEVPQAFRKYLHLVDQGASLVDLAQWSRSHSKSHHRFRNLTWFLNFLYERDLLKDSRAVELAEALRPDYTWRDSIVFESLFSLELFKFKKQKPRSYMQRMLVAFILFFLLPGVLLRIPLHVINAPENWSELESAWPALMAFILVFSIGRSARSVIQTFLMRFMTAFPAALRIRFEPLSISLTTDDASKANGGGLYVLSSAVALLGLAAPMLFEVYFGLPKEVMTFIPFFTLLLFVADLSPFRQSALTEILRAYYVYSDRTSAQRRTTRTTRSESMIRGLHILSCVTWVACSGGFFAFYLRDLLTLAKRFLEFTSPEAGISSVLLGLVLLAITASLVDDIISGVGDGGGSDRLSIRRLWRRKSKLMASEAIKGKSRAATSEELEHLPFLRQMDPQAREVLLSNSEIISVGAREVVCRQGDRDRTLYIVLEGRLAVGKRTSTGRRRIITFLESGSVFGEVAFFLGDKRQADVIVSEDAKLLAIHHDGRIADLDRARSSELQLRVWFLQALVSSTMFRDLPSEALDALIFSGEKRVFQPGDKIILEGAAGDACFFIVQGQASVTQNFDVINKLKGGDAFGEIALLQPELYRTATVQADSELVTVRVDAEKFWMLLASHLPLALQIEELANRRLSADGTRGSV